METINEEMWSDKFWEPYVERHHNCSEPERSRFHLMDLETTVLIQCYGCRMDLAFVRKTGY